MDDLQANHYSESEVAREELACLMGPLHEEFVAVFGDDDVRRQIGTWNAMVVVLDSGEHRPHRFRGRRPS